MQFADFEFVRLYLLDRLEVFQLQFSPDQLFWAFVLLLFLLFLDVVSKRSWRSLHVVIGVLVALAL